MRRFLARYLDKITGVLEGFDRLVFRGWIKPFCYPAGVGAFLRAQGVLQKNFEAFAEMLTGLIRHEAEVSGERLHEKVHYLRSPKTSKEMVARNYLLDRQIRRGPICVLSALEPCWTWEMHRDRKRESRQDLRQTTTKCLHHYHYFLDRRFGFGHVRVQTWFPFQVRICLNGREFLGRRMDQRRLRYQRADNCFPWIASPERAQELMDEMLQLPWSDILDEIAFTANPMLRTLAEQLGRRGFDWGVWQAEWATDIMFQDAATLGECYPAFVRYAMEHLKTADVMRFLGRKLHGNFQGEVTTDYKRRVEGVRVKHWVNGNSQKAYDKWNIYRLETTFNDPSEFKVVRKTRDPHSVACLRPIRRSIIDLGRLARVGRACNRRYLDSMATVGVETPLERLVEPLTRPAELGRSRVRGLRPWAELDVRLLEAVGDGKFIANGFRNRDILPLVFPDPPTERRELRKVTAKVTRLLRLLRAHGLIKRIEGTHRYLVTTRGRTAISAILAAHKATLTELLQCA